MLLVLAELQVETTVHTVFDEKACIEKEEEEGIFHNEYG